MNCGVVIVTGAGGGIGKAVALQLLKSGYTVAAQSRNDEVLEREFADRPDCIRLKWDISNIGELDEFINSIVKNYGQIRGLVHCAGFDKLSPLYLTRVNDIEALLHIHAVVPMRMCSLISKRGNAALGCSIVLISSLAAHEGAAGHTAYAAAKGALEGFLAPAAGELADRGIRLNIVVPGAVETGMMHGYTDKMNEEQYNAFKATYPLGIGMPEDVASSVAFLMDDCAKWITGQKLLLDGGHMCRKG